MVPWQPVGIGLNVPKRVRKVTGAMADYLSEKKKRRASSASASADCDEHPTKGSSDGVVEDGAPSGGPAPPLSPPRGSKKHPSASSPNKGRKAGRKGAKTEEEDGRSAGTKIKIKVKRRSSISSTSSITKKRVLVNGNKLTMHEVLTTTVLNSLGNRPRSWDELQTLAMETCSMWNVSPGKVSRDRFAVCAPTWVVDVRLTSTDARSRHAKAA